MADKNKDKLMRALEKKAFGYAVEERSAEYDSDGNEIKNKVTTKDVPPDLSAIKLLLELREDEPELSEEDLLRERERLIRELKSLSEANVKSNKR